MAVTIDGTTGASLVQNATVTPAKLTQPKTMLTQQSASGTAVNFTGIPSWATKVTVVLNNLSTASTGVATLRIGAGSVDNTGYESGIGYVTTTSVAGSVSATSGFELIPSGNAAAGLTGVVALYNIGSNVWVINGSVQLSQSTYAAYTCFFNGVKTLSGALDRLQITTTGGTDTFDAGTINVFYE